MSAERDPDERVRSFLAEAWPALTTLESARGYVSGRPEATVAPLVAAVYRLKRAAALHGFPDLAKLADLSDETLQCTSGMSDEVRDRTGEMLGELVTGLRRVVEGISATGQEDVEAIARLSVRVSGLLPGVSSKLAALEPVSAEVAAGVTARAPAIHSETRGSQTTCDTLPDYFRIEASEHLDTIATALLALEQRGRSDEELATLFRAVHTLKGAAYVIGSSKLGDRAHQFEEVLAAVRETRIALTPPVMEALFAGVDALRALLAGGDGPTAGSLAAFAQAVALLGPTAGISRPPLRDLSRPRVSALGLPRPSALPEPSESVPASANVPSLGRLGIRVTPERLDSLMHLTAELVITRNRLDRDLLRFEHLAELQSASLARIGTVAKEIDRERHNGRPPRGVRVDGAHDLRIDQAMATCR